LEMVVLEKIQNNDTRNNNRNCVEVKPQYFVVILSKKSNLDKCIKCKIAGFPETRSGMWAYLDINKGDYVSFYYNGKIINLYKVTDRFIPKSYQIVGNNPKNKQVRFKKCGKGARNVGSNTGCLHDQVPLDGCADKWDAIITKKGAIYFPYRFNLELVASGEKMIFDEAVQRFGLNLIPRGGLQKSHVQLPLSVASNIFECKVHPYMTVKRCLSFDDFITLFKRWDRIYRKSANLIKDEFFLQVLIKRILAFFPELCFKVGNKQEVEILSEQAVEGGEVDLVIRYNGKDKVFIEVKNHCLLKDFKTGNINSFGRKACAQLNQYKSFDKSRVTKCIAGKTNKLKKNSPILLRVRKLGQKGCDFVMEVNESFEFENVDGGFVVK